MTTLEQWLINITYIFGILIFVFCWLIYLRSRYSKQVIGRVLSEFITPEGNSYTKLLPVSGGMITIPPKGKKKGRTYAVADIATYMTDYPAVPGFLAILQTKARKAIFDEDSWEPLTNRSGKLLLNPRRLFNVTNEKFSELGVERSGEDMAGKVAGKVNFSWTYVMIGAIALGVIMIGYYVSQNMSAVNASLGLG